MSKIATNFFQKYFSGITLIALITLFVVTASIYIAQIIKGKKNSGSQTLLLTFMGLLFALFLICAIYMLIRNCLQDKKQKVK